MSLNRVDNGIVSDLSLRSATWRWVAVIAEAVAPVKPGSAYMRALQWMLRAGKHGDVRITELRRIERITAGLMNIHVSRNGGDGKNLNVGRAKRHDQSNGVVGSSVGINQERKLHATQDNKLEGETLNKKPVDPCRRAHENRGSLR